MKLDYSYCKDGKWLHNFELIAQYYNGVYEQCSRCHKKMFFRVDQDGRPINRIYLNYHVRQVLYPQHRRFLAEYPNSKLSNKKNFNV